VSFQQSPHFAQEAARQSTIRNLHAVVPRSATAGYIGCESLGEAEPFQQLSKLDVVAGHGAEQENQ
jgi:hypothetical protein